MHFNRFKKRTIQYCLLGGLSFFSSSSFAQNVMNHSEPSEATASFLEGSIVVPNGIDPTSIFVQVIGLNSNDKLTSQWIRQVDATGYFSFNNVFPAGSSVTLMIWDSEGLLDKRYLSAAVTKKGGLYSIALNRSSFTRDLSRTFSQEQDAMLAGLCGQVVGAPANEIEGSHISLNEMFGNLAFQANYFDQNNLPAPTQDHLAANGYFCVFNAASSNNLFFYSVSVQLRNGEVRSFKVFLPPTSFINDIELDVKSALYRPIKSFAWQGDNTKAQTNWQEMNQIQLTTSADYSPILVKKRDPIFFPLGEEFLTIEYNTNNKEWKDQFFILQSRTDLFNQNILNAMPENYTPGQVYVDTLNPIVLKIFDPTNLNGASNFLEPLHANTLGSAFVHLDLSEFGIEKNSISVFLRNLTGETVSQFQPIALSNASSENEMSGFFYFVPPGLYQLYVTDLSQNVLWTQIVQSFPNKTQVLTNVSQTKLLLNQELSMPQAQRKEELQALNQTIPTDPTQPEEVIENEITQTAQELQELQTEKTLSLNNDFLKIDARVACEVPQDELEQRAQKSLEEITQPNNQLFPIVLPTTIAHTPHRQSTFEQLNDFLAHHPVYQRFVGQLSRIFGVRF